MHGMGWMLLKRARRYCRLNDSVDDETASRFVDFMSGAVYLAHGSIELLNDDVLICLPETVRLDKDRLTDFQGIPAWKGPNL